MITIDTTTPDWPSKLWASLTASEAMACVMAQPRIAGPWTMIHDRFYERQDVTNRTRIAVFASCNGDGSRWEAWGRTWKSKERAMAYVDKSVKADGWLLVDASPEEKR